MKYYKSLGSLFCLCPRKSTTPSSEGLFQYSFNATKHGMGSCKDWPPPQVTRGFHRLVISPMSSPTLRNTLTGAANLLASSFSLLKACWPFTIKTTTAVHTRVSQGNLDRPEPVSSSQTSPIEHSSVAPGPAGRPFRGSQQVLHGSKEHCNSASMDHNQSYGSLWTIPPL